MNSARFHAALDGAFHWPAGRARCAVGKAGGVAAADKREGDGKSPLGRWPMLDVLYRADRMAAPVTALPVRALTPDDGWCDAPEDPLYNQPVSHPYPASAERLWRDDGVYDLIVTLGHNRNPVVPGLGSAIFLHVARPDFSGTEGCIALALPDLLTLLALAGPDDCLEICSEL